MAKHKHRLVGRYVEILSVLTRHGFGELTRNANVYHRFRAVRNLIPSRFRRELVDVPLPIRIRRALEALGPTFIKLGQLLANRHDLLPMDIVRELESLQDDVPPFPAAQVVRAVERQFGRPLGEVFPAFDLVPIAAASIAQVHRATIPSGELVAVKIRRPGITRTVDADVAILHRLADLADRHFWRNRVFSAREVADEFDKQIHRELDFHHEMLNIRKFHQHFDRDRNVIVPRVFQKYCTDEILTIQFVEGAKLSEVMEEPTGTYDTRKLGDQLADLVLTQIFLNGYFHADPHPGNIIIVGSDTFCFVDFGMMGSIPPNQLEDLNSLILGMVQRDPTMLTRAVIRLTHAELEVDHVVLENRMHDYMEEYLDLPLQDFDFTAALLDLISLLADFRMRIPVNLSYMLKALMTLEDIGTRLNPRFEMVAKIREYRGQILAHQYNPERLLSDAYLTAREYADVISEFPTTARLLQRFLRKNELKLIHTGLDPVRETMDQIGFRLVYGLVLSSLLVSSALIVLAGVGPKWHGIPIMGLIGFSIGGAMGIVFLLFGFVRMLRWRFRRGLRL